MVRNVKVCIFGYMLISNETYLVQRYTTTRAGMLSDPGNWYLSRRDNPKAASTKARLKAAIFNEIFYKKINAHQHPNRTFSRQSAGVCVFLFYLTVSLTILVYLSSLSHSIQ